MRVRTGAAVVAVIAVLGGCSADRDRASPTTTTEAPPAAADAQTGDADLLRSYVDAVNRGDLDTADEMRCTPVRAEDEQTLESIASQARRLVEERGPTVVVSIEPVDTGFYPPMEGGDPAAYAMTIANDDSDEGRLLVHVVTEDGGRRLCGSNPEAAERLHGEARPALGDLGPTSVGPRDLMPDVQLADHEVVYDERGTPPDGATDSWGRSWQHHEHGGCSTGAYRFGEGGAPAWAAELLADYLPDAIDSFELPGRDGVVGVRVLALGWLSVQPPGSGPYVDELVALRGDTVLWAGCGAMEPGSGHEQTIRLMDAMLDNADG
ncbi:hypothetical protein [Actinomarinicola tropica]|uniref:Uncharacterized protein n=1 Tax=Actinomarinicola tropica TaxID=2789776 RepID=A0A5Q2RG55_9ACTN|nr:hypothetical protein [Actinomarinicola tropica]QGG95788.1 hypothetical protein GH723_12155 [Actinomarinicola tropica]